MTSDYNPSAAKLHGVSLPPKSYVVVWKKNQPEVRQTHWAPGYTPGHCATPKEALAAAGVDLLQQVSDVREKWLRLTAAGAHLAVSELANAFGQIQDSTPVEEEIPYDMAPSDAWQDREESITVSDKCPAYIFIDGGNDVAACSLVPADGHTVHYAPGVGEFTDEQYQAARTMLAEFEDQAYDHGGWEDR